MTADTVGGVWTYSLELARALALHGVEVILATMGAPLSEEQRAESQSVPNLQVLPSTYKLEWMEDPWPEVTMAGDWLLSLEDRFRPDIIHLNGYSHGDLPWSTPVVMVAHSCVLSWWRAVKKEEAPVSWQVYREKVSAGLHAADLVAAPSRAMLSELEAIYGRLPNPRVIHNGRLLARSTGAPKEAFILTAGRLWDEAKNVSLLAEIAPQLPWPVFFAGEDKHPDRRGRALHPHVNLLGRLSLSEMEALFCKASIYALPARYEPFGLSALEAALAGCALVLGDIPSLREIWGNSAVFVPPEDPRVWEHALKRLIGDRELVSELTINACRKAVEYSSEKMGSEYWEAYKSVLQDERHHHHQLVCES
ncbi:MAG: glycosyltransferase [Verrucomicrobiales bacterium]|nr:glycosyltransferase [Verrucomicrobiales bacterium]